jgi:hypothetical protein
MHCMLAVVLILLAVMLVHFRRRRARQNRTLQRSRELTTAGIEASAAAKAAHIHPQPEDPMMAQAVPRQPGHPESDNHAGFVDLAVEEDAHSLTPLAPLHQDMVAWQKQLEAHDHKEANHATTSALPPPYEARNA